MPDKQQTNKNGQRHGYWEKPFKFGGAPSGINFTGYYINGIAFGSVTMFWSEQIEKRYYVW